MVTKEESELFDQRATQLESLGYKSSVSRGGFEKEDKYVPATLMLGASTRDWNKFIEEQTPSHPMPESVEEWISLDEYKTIALERLKDKPVIQALMSTTPFEKWATNIHNLIDKELGAKREVRILLPKS